MCIPHCVLPLDFCSFFSPGSPVQLLRVGEKLLLALCLSPPPCTGLREGAAFVPRGCCPSSELCHWLCMPFLLTPPILGAPGARWEGHTADPVQWKCRDWRGNGTKRGIPHNPQLLAGLLRSTELPRSVGMGRETHGSLWSHPAMKGSKWILQRACRREGNGTPGYHLPQPHFTHTHSCSVSAPPLASAPCSHVAASHPARRPQGLSAPGAPPAALPRSPRAQHSPAALALIALSHPAHSDAFYTLPQPRSHRTMPYITNTLPSSPTTHTTEYSAVMTMAIRMDVAFLVLGGPVSLPLVAGRASHAVLLSHTAIGSVGSSVFSSMPRSARTAQTQSRGFESRSRPAPPPPAVSL